MNNNSNNAIYKKKKNSKFILLLGIDDGFISLICIIIYQAENK